MDHKRMNPSWEPEARRSSSEEGEAGEKSSVRTQSM